MRFARVLLTLSLLSASSGAFADKFTRFKYEWYLAGGIWSVDYRPDSGADYNMPGAMLKAGYEFNRQLAAEAHFGLTESQTRSTFGGTVPVELSVAALGAGFLKYSWLYEGKRGWARFYGLLGASLVDVEARAQGSTTHDSEASLAYGLGVDVFGSDRLALVLEWVRYQNQSDYEISTPMIGVLYRFE